jgi:hypothetical protein
MTELEQALTRLGAELEFPSTPDVAGAVRQRLAEAPRRRPLGRPLALALAALAVLAGTVMAVPPARSAVLEWLGLQGATVERVETLPELAAGARGSLELGRLVSLAGAGELASFDVLVPEALGEPDDVYHSDSPPGGRTSLVYRPREDLPDARGSGIGLLVTEFRGDVTPDFVGKLADQGVRITRVEVEGDPGIWLEGSPHVVFFRAADGEVRENTSRLAGNTLLLELGGVLVRLEGEISRERALEIAASLG